MESGNAPQEYGQGNSPVDAASIVQRMAWAAEDLPAREPGLMIATHGKHSPVGEWLLRQMGHRDDRNRICVSGDPGQIVRSVRELALGGTQVSRAAFGFELHHLTAPQALEVLQWTREMLAEHGVVFFVDYALAGVPAHEVRAATCTELETRQVMGEKYKGDRDRWIADHRTYTGALMRELVLATGYANVTDLALPAARHLVMGTGSPSVRPAEWRQSA